MGDPYLSSEDYHNFTQSSPTHRLPTLNGVDALLGVIEVQRPLSTNLQALDQVLVRNETDEIGGGIPSGRVTEIWGPPGCGKTQFAMQIAARVLESNDESCCVWIDTGITLCTDRLVQFLVPQSFMPDDAHISEDNEQQAVGIQQRAIRIVSDRFTQYLIDDFPQLMAYLHGPIDELLPDKTRLLVLDDFSNLLLAGLPHNDKPKAEKTTNMMTREKVLSKEVNARRAAIIGAISANLARLAAARNMAIVVINKASTSRSGDNESILRSALSVKQWSENVSTRIVLYRDFWPEIDTRGMTRGEKRLIKLQHRYPLRLAAVERLDGQDVRTDGIRFVILKDRLHGVDPAPQITITAIEPTSSPSLESDDSEEAMSNLDLVDTRNDDDQYFGDEMPLSMPSQKRKIDEVSESDDDLPILNGQESEKADRLKSSRGFILSSQLGQAEDEEHEKHLIVKRSGSSAQLNDTSGM